jgi:adhesin transport system membrane fusion protein
MKKMTLNEIVGSAVGAVSTVFNGGIRKVVAEQPSNEPNGRPGGAVVDVGAPAEAGPGRLGEPPTDAANSTAKASSDLLRRAWLKATRVFRNTGDDVPGSAHLTVALCGVMVISFGAWASFSTLDVVSMVTGEVIPASQVKTIQHLEGGIVREILIKEGNPVKLGQPLIVLEPTVSSADVGELKARLSSLSADIARLDALSQGLPKPTFPKGFAEEHPELARQALKRFETQLQRHRSEVKRQEEIIAQRQYEIREITTRIENSRLGLKLVREQITISESLLADNLTNRFQHLDLLKEAQRLQGAMETDSAALERTKAALMEARAELGKIRSIFNEEIQKSLDEARLSHRELSQRLQKFEDSLKRTIVRSPVDGVVKTLKVVTIGGVVRPGEPLADIVPAGDHLVVEAKLPTRDIGHVAVGQAAVVKLATPDAIRYGNLKGNVINVSPDALVTSDGKMTFYKVRIATEQDFFQHGEYRYNLIPGLQVVASIQTGKRTVLEYIVDPVRYSMGHAAQER